MSYFPAIFSVAALGVLATLLSNPRSFVASLFFLILYGLTMLLMVVVVGALFGSWGFNLFSALDRIKHVSDGQLVFLAMLVVFGSLISGKE